MILIVSVVQETIANGFYYITKINEFMNKLVIDK